MVQCIPFAISYARRLGQLAVVLLLLVGTNLGACAQAPSWQTALAFAQPTGSSSLVVASTLDDQGNVFLTGRFTGSITLGTTTLRSVNSFADTFVAKWNPASNSFTWALRLGGTDDDKVQAIAVQGSSIYLTGNASLSTIFVIKLLDAGTTASVVWTQQVTGSRYPNAYAVAVAGTNVYIAGCFEGTLNLGSVTLTNVETSGRYDDLFVAKLSDAGTTATFRWAQRGGSAFDDCAYALAVNGSSVYVAGSFIGNATTKADFGSTQLVGASDYDPDVVVAKLTDAGNSGSFTWAQRAGGVSSDIPQALVVSGATLYVTGTFGSTYRSQADFGSTRLTNASATGDTDDIFITKLTDAGSTGSFSWAQRAGGLLNDRGNTLAVSGQNVYVAGWFASLTASFGSTVLTNPTTSGIGQDSYVAHLTDAGSTSTIDWVQQAGGIGSESVASLLVSGPRLYAAGYFTSATARFGNTTITHPNSDDLTAGFVASLGTAPLAVAAPALAQHVHAYPNPAHQRFTVELAGLIGVPTMQVDLLNAIGQLVRHQMVTLPTAGTQLSLDVADLATGLYTLRVQAGKEVIAQHVALY